MIHLAAYLVPITAALGLWLGGAWSWLTVVFVYGLVPLADALVGIDPRNADDAALHACAPGVAAGEDAVASGRAHR